MTPRSNGECYITCIIYYGCNVNAAESVISLDGDYMGDFDVRFGADCVEKLRDRFLSARFGFGFG